MANFASLSCVYNFCVKSCFNLWIVRLLIPGAQGNSLRRKFIRRTLIVQYGGNRQDLSTSIPSGSYIKSRAQASISGENRD